jgi:hypothetical protein
LKPAGVCTQELSLPVPFLLGIESEGAIMTAQIETATIVGTITQSGNATITVTAYGMTGSPKAVSVAVTLGDSAAVVAQAVRYALATDVDISGLFLVGGTSANVSLTRRIEEPNDATLNIAVANGTCLGLTAAPTSSNTAAGVAADLYYITVSDFKTYRKITGTTDDALILSMIAAATGYLELNWGYVYRCDADSDRDFYEGDVEENRLKFDKPLAQITSITNGDGSTLSTTDYITLPRDAPYYGVKLSNTSTVAWVTYPDPITVTGRWAYSVTPPSRVKEACKIVTNFLYDKRSTGVDADRQIITAEGIILPAGISKAVADLMGAKNHV